ncbi:nitroreductase family protein [Paenibacillus sp. MMS18-CY102]|uniref:nitroreductase family protein n=1 Tax=Paenibacillus sp. MMS18-CY102 TaxID=2682849 RepID=UPI001365F751|nr:nitroreductase family protein [Paenibacillus sp. MMS18-CY102]MWC27589.1 nitroreductase [Paenibacillus sp. MMS18-CY102]
MNIAKTIRERRTIRKFHETPIEQERILSLLNNAASLYESEETPHWRCVHYSTFESRQRLADSMFARIKESKLGKLIPAPITNLFKKQVSNTPVNLVFIAEAAENQRLSDNNYAAVCSIMQNLQLLGWESGLGMLWFTDPMIQGESFFNEIGLREGERFAGILHMGYFDQPLRDRRKRTPAEKKWLAMDGGVQRHSDGHQVSSQSVLDILNEAVWAPNDGMREPWRFIYVAGDDAASKLGASYEDASLSFLLVVAKEEADPHKREEDYAAVCCLIQNFRLLTESVPWHVRRMIPEWIYDRERCKPFGIRPQERIVAVLELGGDARQSNAATTSPVLNITHL